ncbi:hypothetical protein [Pseudomonas fluorescens]|uniref:hypothetical protein n=1 Tax=Pseudomonas fluorescens TaxID=294 RepID=UPI0012405E27|nr:hypothetical protein [Pseudomonas fluorescens]
MKRTNVMTILCLVLGLLAGPALAKPVVTAICDEPKGPRIDVGGWLAEKNGKRINQIEDSFTGVFPTFILDDTDLKRITYVFGNTRSAEGLGVSARGAQQAHVLSLSGELITAVQVAANGIAIFSLYPASGFGFFTYHESNPIGGAEAKAVTFVSKCEFSTTD